MIAFAQFSPISTSTFSQSRQRTVVRNQRKCRVVVRVRVTSMKTRVDDETETKTTRLFSNVQLNERGELKRQKASEWSCAALIAGTMIGAGVIALPDVTEPAGFVPSSTALLGVWAFMCAQAFLISEVSVSTACSLGRPSGVSLLSLGRITLGTAGGFITAAAYTFLHFAILTAYTAQGGTISHELWALLTHSNLGGDESLTQVGFALILGTALYSLSDKAVEKTNDALVIGVLATFAAVVFSLAPAFDIGTLLSSAHIDKVPNTIPVLLVSCVFHNIIPTVASRLECDIPRIRRAIVLGSSLPLALFLVYNAVSLGANPSISPTIATFAVDSFSLLAIITSFIGFVAGLVDLWSDVRISLFGEKPDEVQRSLIYNYLGTIIPPSIFCLLNKD